MELRLQPPASTRVLQTQYLIFIHIMVKEVIAYTAHDMWTVEVELLKYKFYKL